MAVLQTYALSKDELTKGAFDFQIYEHRRVFRGFQSRGDSQNNLSLQMIEGNLVSGGATLRVWRI